MTAAHVYGDYRKKTGGRGELLRGTELVVRPRVEVLEEDRRRDFALVRIGDLRGGPFLKISSSGDMHAKEVYSLLGYPIRLKERWPRRLTAAISTGQLKEDWKDISEVGRRAVGGRVWSGFSGGPVISNQKEVVAIILSTSLSFTETDYAEVLPVWGRRK